MHGNTDSVTEGSAKGYKTRKFDNVARELQLTFEVRAQTPNMATVHTLSEPAGPAGERAHPFIFIARPAYASDSVEPNPNPKLSLCPSPSPSPSRSTPFSLSLLLVCLS